MPNGKYKTNDVIGVRLDGIEKDVGEINDEMSGIRNDIKELRGVVEEKANDHEIRLVKMEAQVDFGKWVLMALAVGIAIPFARQMWFKLFNGKGTRKTDGD